MIGVRSAINHVLAVLVILVPVVAGATERESGPLCLPCDNPMPRVQQGVFDLGVGRAHLQDGTHCLKPFPEYPNCEWTIALTRVEQWGANREFLLLVINSNHDSPGAWDSVFVYVCQRGVYVQTFSDRYLYGAKIEIGKKSDLWITGGLWQRGDPTCCPSSERRRHHVWNQRQQRFVIVGSEVRPK
jgi:hypothetical protein